MLWPLRNSSQSRAIAAVLAAFCLLSSGRALVPGMCATLAAVKEDGAGACCSTKFGCPASDESPNKSAAVIRSLKPKTECAFCHMAKGTLQIKVGVLLTGPGSEVSLKPIAPHDRLAEFERWNFARPRDPPSDSLHPFATA